MQVFRSNMCFAHAGNADVVGYHKTLLPVLMVRGDVSKGEEDSG